MIWEGGVFSIYGGGCCLCQFVVKEENAAILFLWYEYPMCEGLGASSGCVQLDVGMKSYSGRSGERKAIVACCIKL